MSFSKDNVVVPKEMCEALDSDDPVEARRLLAKADNGSPIANQRVRRQRQHQRRKCPTQHFVDHCG